ncbi:hypothetical protein F4054_20525 [Candidatus Poribacteria bacterium]|nr:hypothetical protein [Candidatus Poribacteria bacterium]MYG07610.1 hypothetical protein [Candidatus Poribacteria bacterium]MYK24632.1 hypothetical protein [Candidatus Poribacteria bacterium]
MRAKNVLFICCGILATLFYGAGEMKSSMAKDDVPENEHIYRASNARVTKGPENPVAAAWQRLTYISENIYEWGGEKSPETPELIEALEALRMEYLRVEAAQARNEAVEITFDPCGEDAAELMSGLSYLSDPSSAEYLVRHTCEGTFGRGIFMFDGVVDIGPPSVPHLIPYLDQEDWSRYHAIELLGKISERYRDALGGIIEYIILPKLEAILAGAEGWTFYRKRELRTIINRLHITDATKVPPNIAELPKLPNDIDPDAIPGFSIAHSEGVWYIYNRPLSSEEREVFDTLKADPINHSLPPAVLKALAISRVRTQKASEEKPGADFEFLIGGTRSLEHAYRQIDDFYEIIRCSSATQQRWKLGYYDWENSSPEKNYKIYKYGALINEYEKDLAAYKVRQKALEAEYPVVKVERQKSLKYSEVYENGMATNESAYEAGHITQAEYVAEFIRLWKKELQWEKKQQPEFKRLQALPVSIKQRYASHFQMRESLRKRQSAVEHGHKVLATHVGTE